MTDHESAPRQTAPANARALLLFGFGVLFLTGYLAISSEFGGFFNPDLTYVGYGRFAQGPLPVSSMRYFSLAQLSALFWGMLLLLPATVCFAFGLAHCVSRESAERLLKNLSSLRGWPYLAGLCLLAGLIFVFISQVLFQGQALTDDERVYGFQAALLAMGRLVMPAPPGAACFENIFIDLRGGFLIGRYPVGHPLILAAGMLLGSARVFTVLLPALTPALVYFIGREQFGERTGRLAAGLLVLSPFFLVASSTTLPHGCEIFLLALFTLGYLKSRPGESWLWPAAAGLALGQCFNMRPQSAVPFGAPFALWTGARLVASWRGGAARTGERRALWGRMSLMLLCFLAAAAISFAYNKAVVGGFLAFPNAPKRMPFGFHANPQAYRHTLARGVSNLFVNGARMNAWLFGWPLSLMFAAVYFAGRAGRKIAWIYAAVIAAFCLQFALYRFSGDAETGPRYYFPLLIPLALLSAEGMIDAHGFFKSRFASGRMRGEILIPAFVALSVLLSLATFCKERALHYLHLTDNIALPYREVERNGLKNAIVRIDSLPLTGWLFGFRQSNPDLKDDVLYVHSVEPKHLLALMDYMPSRSVYSLRYDASTEDKIVLRRLTRDDVRKEQQAHTELPGAEVKSAGPAGGEAAGTR